MDSEVTNLIYERSEFIDSPLKTRKSGTTDLSPEGIVEAHAEQVIEGLPGERLESQPILAGAAEEKRRRAKSSLRMKYEAEVEVIQRKLGSLDQMRETLGLSQRKMCQLLLVDPSAWTRWNNGEDDAPPHIYKMLQWYLALQEKYPALDVNFWLSTVAQVRAPNEVLELRARILSLEKDYEAKTRELERALAQTNQNLVQATIAGQNSSDGFSPRAVAEGKASVASFNSSAIEMGDRSSSKLHALAMGVSIGAALMAMIQFLLS